MADIALDRIKSAAGVVAAPQRKPRQKDRRGLKGLLTYHDPAVLKQLRIIAAEQDRNQQQLMREALNMIFARYGKPQIA